MKKKCKKWRGYILPSGYGKIVVGGRSFYAHRLTWMLERGQIPRKKLVCHTCDNPACVEIDHLFLGTIAENNNDKDRKKRGNNAKKAKCIRGHLLSKENTFVRKGKFSSWRICRLCAKRDYLIRREKALSSR